MSRGSVDGDAGEGMVHRALDGGGVQAARAPILNGTLFEGFYPTASG